jgi:tRNA-dihydrouridine synthase B
MLPWFAKGKFPLYLAPMAGITDRVFRSICKEFGADVMVTEFVSSEGIIRRDDRTRKYTEFDDAQRPVGVQLFGADGHRMAEAAKKVIDWKQPDFIDLNFGCPVNKVVSKNGGSSLLRNCPALAEVASAVVAGVGDQVPVTGKIRIGWDSNMVNAVEVTGILEDCGISAVSVHGRTRSQGYSGEADWSIIDACARSANIPVVGNGDIHWIFRDAKHYLETGQHPEPVSNTERWKLITRHCREAIAWGRYGNECRTMMAMRSRLMAYTKGLPAGKRLRAALCRVESLGELEDIAGEYLNHHSKAASGDGKYVAA